VLELIDASLTYSTDSYRAASLMGSDIDQESESSLPTQHLHTFPSSPPVAPALPSSSLVIQVDWLYENMDSRTQSKSEPAVTQHEEGAKPPLRHIGSEDTERPPSAQQVHEDTYEEEEEATGFDPAERIVEFDWDALHERYHKAMETCHDEESKLAQEFESLMAVLLSPFQAVERSDLGVVLPHLGRVRTCSRDRSDVPAVCRIFSRSDLVTNIHFNQSAYTYHLR
jgi:hypothetical protein